MISFLDRLSQYTLVTNKQCHFECLGCDLWNQPASYGVFRALIETGAFFTIYPKKRVYNIVGGDPLLHPDIFLLLAYLKSNGIKIRVWTNGGIAHEYIEKALPFVDVFVV